MGVKKGNIPWNKGKRGIKGHLHSEKTKRKIGKAHKKENLSKDTLKKMSISGKKAMLKLWQNPEYKEKMKKAHIGKMSGKKHYLWKGGITPENNKIRTSAEYRLWIKSVFERDDFTCQKYGIKGGNLVAHHINNFAQFPELRFAIDNGITLSEKVHKEFHKKYGMKNNTKGQLEEFINLK